MKYYLLGIEICSKSINIAISEKNRSSYKLIDLTKIEYDSTPEGAGIVLKAFLENKFKSLAKFDVVLSINEAYTFLRQIEIPKPKNTNLDEAIHWEIKSGASDLPEDPIYKYEIIEQKKDSVLAGIVAVKAKTAEEFASIFALPNVNLVAIEPSSISLCRAYGRQLKKNVLILSQDHNELFLTALSNKIPVFSSSSLKGTQQQIASWIKKTAEYIQDDKNLDIEQIISADPDIDSRLFDKKNNFFSKISFENFLLLKNKKINLSKSQKIDPIYFAALGALYRFQLDDMLSQINLLPRTQMIELEKIGRIQKKIKRLIIVNKINILFFAFAVFFIIISQLATYNLNKKIATAQQFIQNHPGQQLTQKVTAANNLIANIEKIEAGQNGAAVRLGPISSYTPKALSFTTIIVSSSPEEKWEIRGTGARNDILSFYHELKKQTQAKSVELAYSSLSKPEDSSFEITIIW